MNELKKYITVFLLLVLVLDIYAEEKDSQKNDQGKIVTLSAKGYEKEIATGVVLVDYWAVWCGPCRKMEPILKDIAAETSVKVAKLNVDDYRAFARRQKVKILPTMIIYKDGKEVERLVGAYTKAELLKVLSAYM